MPTAFNVWTPEGVVVSGTSVGNPNALWDINPLILTGDTNVMKMWYGVYDSGNVNYLESADGLTSWTALSGNPVLTGAYFPTVRKIGSTYYCYASGSITPLSINLWTSPDGKTWTAQGLVLSVGSAGAWDSNVIAQLNLCDFIGGVYYAYYTGSNGTGIYGTGLATSTNLTTWTKVGSAPLITGLNNTQATATTFMKVGNTYYAWGQGQPNSAQLAANGFTSFMRWSSPTASGPWTQLAVSGSQVATYYAATPADFASLASNNQLGDPSMVVANGNIYQYYDVGTGGGEGKVNQAVATGITPTQLVAGYEGVVGAPISGAPQLNLVTLASDNFQRANGSLGSNWTPISTTGVFAAGQIISHEATTNTQNNADSFWNALTWANDQWSMITAGITSATSDIGANARMNTSGVVTEYRTQWGGGALGTSQSWLIRSVVAGTATTILTGTALTVSLGDTLMVVPNGTTLLFYYNGICLGAVVDSTVTSGAAGMELFSVTNPANVGISAWSGGNFQAAPPIPSTSGNGSLMMLGCGS
jgi:hypothetical protein